MAKKNTHKKKRITADQVVMPKQSHYDMVVIGGGAAGLAAAISAAQHAQRKRRPLRVAMLEQGRRIGASVMRAGNGRCNFSNTDIEVHRYWSSPYVQSAFSAYDANPALPAVLDWFADLGLEFSTLPGSKDGLLYPASRKADSVLSVLAHALDELGVEVYPNIRVRSVKPDKETGLGGHKIVFENALADDPSKASLHAAQVVFAAGGQYAEELLDGYRFTFVPRRPVLAPLAVSPRGEETDWKELDGIRVQACVAAPACGLRERGEVLFREYGISGIVVFNASRQVAAGDALQLDLAPDLSFAELLDKLTARHARFAERTAAEFLDGFMLSPVAHAVMRQQGISLSQPLGEDRVDDLARGLKQFDVMVEGIAEPKSAQVQRGGVAVECVDPSTFEAAPGLRIVGEALDVDGPCGGYNLHWAWTSGIAAGAAAAQAIGE